MFLNRMESTNQTRLPAVARAHCDVFQAGLPWQGMAKLYKGSIFCHHRDTICHPKSGYVTTKLHGTSTCGCNNVFRQSYFHVSYRRHMLSMLISPGKSLDYSC